MCLMLERGGGWGGKYLEEVFGLLFEVVYPSQHEDDAHSKRRNMHLSAQHFQPRLHTNQLF